MAKYIYIYVVYNVCFKIVILRSERTSVWKIIRKRQQPKYSVGQGQFHNNHDQKMTHLVN